MTEGDTSLAQSSLCSPRRSQKPVRGKKRPFSGRWTPVWRWSSGRGYLACWSSPRCAPRQVGLLTQHNITHVFYQESPLYRHRDAATDCVWLKNYHGFVKTPEINMITLVDFMLKVSFSRPKDGNCDKLVFF